MPVLRHRALVLLFVLSLPAVTTRLYAADEIEYFAFLRSLWFDADLSFENEYQYFYDRGIARAHRFHETFLEMRSATGLRLNFATIGSALLWAPMYAAADVAVRVGRAFGATTPADGFSRPYLAAIAYGSALYGFLAVLLSAFVAGRVAGEGRWAALSVWLGTPLLFYMYLAPGMAHATSAFAAAAFVAAWLLVRERWSPGGMALLGSLAALMTMVREQDAFLAAGPAADFLWTVFRETRQGRSATGRRLGAAAIGVLAFTVCFLPQAYAYITLNGRLGPDAAIANKMYWTSPHAWRVLFSPRHGLFPWTPLVLLSVIGLMIGAVRLRIVSEGPVRQFVVCLLIAFVAQVYVSGSVDTWTVAGSFGQRRFVSTTVIQAVGLALVIRYSRHRAVLATVIGLCIWWNLGLMAQFGASLMDRQRLDLPRNAYHTFVTVPRDLPALAYRYLFDRSSFYRRSGDE